MKNTANIFYMGIWVLGIYACSPNQAKENTITEEKVPVKTQQVHAQTITQPISTSGLLASKQEVKLSFKTGGIIQSIAVDEGQTVKKGQVLASLNLTEINAQVSQAEQAFDKAQRDLNRAQNLYADSAATKEQVQNATTGLEVASATLQSARFNRQYSTIYAPENGQILKRYAESGELLSPGSPVFVFASASKEQWILRTGVSDRDMVRITLGDKATVQFDAYPGTDFPATVTEIAQMADASKGTFEVELTVDPQGKKLATGMVAKVQILPSQKVAAVIVPIEALIEADGEKGFVYVLSDDKQTVTKTAVTLAGIYDNQVGISSGLEENTTIVTEGNNYLTESSKVKVITQPTAVSQVK
ncbi:efflux RND transporter periplasmic adaptor subunit [Rhodocytophaga aerolata]|uniref:Efflux RND transporter periplasmic adaptor subunit n=1 Tax=Rhodocytophaga aerolata TaxID=455078 RepID=A0ABT8R2R8_9BACT|nr:efflux RND transporter periplasmic adaptor subunit [Rhodocytophaga aerolata]MDO1446224.1 efflux RND transporter periplasmic adaptor subunit [Rhodocytophaga aerolata]